MVINLKRKTYLSVSNIECFKQFSNENATKLFENFRIKNAATDKYSLICSILSTNIFKFIFLLINEIQHLLF